MTPCGNQYLCLPCQVEDRDPVAWLVDDALARYVGAWNYLCAYGYGSLGATASVALTRDGRVAPWEEPAALRVLLMLDGDGAPAQQVTYSAAIKLLAGEHRTLGILPAATVLEIDGTLRGSISNAWEALDQKDRGPGRS